MSTTLEDSRTLADGVNALNQQRTSRAEAAAKFIVYLVIGVLGGLALAHYATPCEGFSLCLAAVVPTHRNWLQRLADRYEAWRLYAAIKHAQQDLAWQYEQLEIAQWECQQIPQQQKVTRAHIDSLQAKLRALGAPVEA